MSDTCCRRDICPLSSPPLRTGFGSQNSRIFHDYIPSLLSLFGLHENGLQPFREYHDWIPLVLTILTTVHTSGSVDCRRRYGDPELAGFLFTYFGSPSKYGGSPSFLRVTGRTAYHRIGIYETSMTTVRTGESVHRLRRNSWITFLTWRRPPAPLFYWQYLDSPLKRGWFSPVSEPFGMGQVWVLHRRTGLDSRNSRVWAITLEDGPVLLGL